MFDVNLQWYGQTINTRSQNRQITRVIRDRCGESNELFHVFGLNYNSPSKDCYSFLVRNRLFVAVHVDISLLVFDSDDLNIKELAKLWDTTPVNYDNLHFVEEFDHFLFMIDCNPVC